MAATAPVRRLDASVDELITVSSIFIGLLADLPAVHRAFLVLWASAVADGELRPRMAASDAAFRGAVTAIVERGQARGEVDDNLDADTFAVMLLGQLRGVALQHLIAGDEIDLAHVRRGLAAAIRALLQPAGQEGTR